MGKTKADGQLFHSYALCQVSDSCRNPKLRITEDDICGLFILWLGHMIRGRTVVYGTVDEKAFQVCTAIAASPIGIRGKRKHYEKRRE